MIADHAIRKKIAKMKLDSILANPEMENIHALAQNIWDCFNQGQRPRYQQVYGALALVSAESLKEASIETQRSYEMPSQANGEQHIMEALRCAPDIFIKNSELIESKGLLFDRNRFYAVPNEFRPGQPLQSLMQKIEPEHKNIAGALILYVASQSTKSSHVFITVAETRLIAALLLPEGPEREQKIMDARPTTKNVDMVEFLQRGHALVEILCASKGLNVPGFVKDYKSKRASETGKTVGVQDDIEDGFSGVSGTIRYFDATSEEHDEASVRPTFEKKAGVPFVPKAVPAPISEPSMLKTLKEIVAKEPKETQEEVKRSALVYLWLQGLHIDGDRRTNEEAARNFKTDVPSVKSMCQNIAGKLSAHYEDLDAKEHLRGSGGDLHQARALRP